MQKSYLNPVDRSRIRSKWNPRIGQNATEWLVRSRFCTVVAPGVGFVGFGFVVIFRIVNVRGLWILGMSVIGAGIVVFVVGLGLWVRMEVGDHTPRYENLNLAAATDRRRCLCSVVSGTGPDSLRGGPVSRWPHRPTHPAIRDVGGLVLLTCRDSSGRPATSR